MTNGSEPLKRLTPETVKTWASESELMEIGAGGSAVDLLQQLVEYIDPDLYAGRVDGDFGKLTQAAVRRFQQLRMIDEDGIVGPITRGELFTAYSLSWHPGLPFDHPVHPAKVYGVYHPRLGYLPDLVLGGVESGRVSYFGGPDDKCDRIYGQAYIRGAESPKALWERHQRLAEMGLLREEIAGLDEYPIVTDWRDREREASTSWCMDPNSYYIAMRWQVAGRNMGYIDAGNPRLLVWSEATGKAVVCLRTDYGPAASGGRLMDLSKGALDVLGLKTDDRARVCWATDDAEIGPLTVG